MEETFGSILTSSFEENGNFTINVILKNPLLDTPKQVTLENVLVGEHRFMSEHLVVGSKSCAMRIQY